MPIKKIITTCLVTNVFVAGVTFASGAADPEIPQTGFYADANFGDTSTTLQGITDNSKITEKHSGFAMNFNLGYKFSKNFAAEIGAYYLPKIKYTKPLNNNPLSPDPEEGEYLNNDSSKNLYAFNVALKVFMPINIDDSLYTFAKIGASYTTVDLNQTKNDEFHVKRLTGLGAIGLGWNAYRSSKMDIYVEAQVFGLLPYGDMSTFIPKGDYSPTRTCPGSWGALGGVGILFTT